MKIVNRKTFLSMPSGTVYCEYESMANWGELCVKRETIANGGDWYYAPLIGVDAIDTGELADTLRDMEEDDCIEVSNDPNIKQRDGMFDSEAMFLILDPKDIEGVVQALIASTKK